MFAVLRANGLRSCYVRPLVYRGYGEMGPLPLKAPIDCLIAAWPWGAYLGGEASTRGIRTRVSSYRCLDDASFARSSKASGHYLSNMLAKIEAVNAGYDEAIVVNDHGHVAEGSTENILSDGVLEGITRDTVLRLLHSEVVPVREVNDREIGKRSRITRRIQERYRDVMLGRDPAFLDFVELVTPEEAAVR